MAESYVNGVSTRKVDRVAKAMGIDGLSKSRVSEMAQSLDEMVEAFRGHPSIVMWVPFNEGWTQYDTARIAEGVATLDPTRLVNSVSGWADRGVGDVHDIHAYPGPGMPPVEPVRAADRRNGPRPDHVHEGPKLFGVGRLPCLGIGFRGLDIPFGQDSSRQVVVAITAGALDLGPWEAIFYGEFDGRRRKRVLVKIVGE